MKPICYIVGAVDPGEICLEPRRPALVIAADGGLTYLRQQGVEPDWIVGDFDSLGHVPQGERVLRHPVEKDDTDMLLAVRTGMEAGCRDFVIYGGLGGRMDHTYANFQTLLWIACRGGRGYLVGDGTLCTVIDSGSVDFPDTCRGTISVFCPDGEAVGVTLRGLQYPLTDAVLRSDFPLGVSNSFLGEAASVSVAKGRLMVMWEEPVAAFLRRI